MSLIRAFRSNPAGMTVALLLTALLIQLWILWGPVVLLARM